MITDTTASGATDSSAADSVSKTLSMMREKLDAIVPDAELQLKAEIVYEINRLKEERGAIILGHNYMEPALFHTVPDLSHWLKTAAVSIFTILAGLLVFSRFRFQISDEL